MKILINPALGTAILRILLGIVIAAHSLYLKLIVFTLAGTAAYFASIGLPEILAYIVFTIEAASGVALIIGYRTQWFALSLVPVLFGATWAHSQNGWLFTNTGGGWEYPLLLSGLAVVLAFLGDGAWSLSAKHSTELKG
jgi:putative oxidoreductase